MPLFYFNGTHLPNYATWWNVVDIETPVQSSIQEDIGIKDIQAICTRLDHENRIESADCDIFVYAVQEVVCRATECREMTLRKLHTLVCESTETAYLDLLLGLIAMRELAPEHECAFWTSSEFPSARDLLMERMRRSKLII